MICYTSFQSNNPFHWGNNVNTEHFFIPMLSFKEAGLSTKLTNGYTLNWIRYGMLSCKLLFMCFFLYIYIEPFLKGNQDSRKMATTIQPTFSSWCTIHSNISICGTHNLTKFFGEMLFQKQSLKWDSITSRKTKKVLYHLLQTFKYWQTLPIIFSTNVTRVDSQAI